MKKIDIGQTINTAANVGVIAGILFLGYEIQQNTATLRSQASQGLQQQISSNSGYLVEDETLVDIVHRGDSDPQGLTPIELQRYTSFRDINFQSWQNMYIQVQEGALSEALVQGWWQGMRNGFENPGIRDYWSRRKYIFSPEFQSFVESEIMALDPSSEVQER